MEREGKVRKARPPFDPASLALPPSFRSLFLGDSGQASFSHSNHQAYPILRDAGKKKQGNNSSSFETISFFGLVLNVFLRSPPLLFRGRFRGLNQTRTQRPGCQWTAP